MSKIIKIVDERETQKQKTKKRTKGDRYYSKRVTDEWFYRALKLDSLQLICKVSLIFKSNLELALSIILKERELYESKHVAVECRCLKIWDLLSFLICSSIIVLKWRQGWPLQLELQLAQVILYTMRDYKSSWIPSLYEK